MLIRLSTHGESATLKTAIGVKNRGTIEGEILKVTWYWVGGERDMSIRLDGVRLHTETVHVYNDNRPPRTSIEVFKRGE